MKTPIKVAIALALSFVLVFLILWQTNLFGTVTKLEASVEPTIKEEKVDLEPTALEIKAKELGCDLTPEDIDDPKTIELVSQKKILPVMSLGFDEAENAPQISPKEEPFTVAWYNEGPKVGSAKGKVLITGHTYPEGGNGIGNELNAGLLKAGDLLKVDDKDGNAVCYRYREEKHIYVVDYDPNSDIVYDEVGKPELLFFVCDNHIGDGVWAGRRMYYADLLTEDNIRSFK